MKVGVFEFPHQRPPLHLFVLVWQDPFSNVPQSDCLTATWGLLIFDKQLNDAPVCPGSMLVLLIIGDLLHQDGGTYAPPKIHDCVACLRGCISIGSEWTEAVPLDGKLGGHNWYQGLDYKTSTAIINNSRASVIKSCTFKIFIAQLGTLKKLQNTQVTPPQTPSAPSCVFLLFIQWLICISLPSPCGTSEQHEVKAGHLLTCVKSRKFSDLQPYLRWPSASSVCRPTTASSQAQDKICSAFFVLCHFPSTNVCLSKHKY